MKELRAILVFIFCVISVVSALTGKGYFCRDPDTGFLHNVNSTWKSETFCGNYTCKLRKKNPNEAKVLFREMNISDVNIARSSTDENANNKDTKDMPVVNQDLSNSPEIAILKSLLTQNDLKKLNINDKVKSPGIGDRFLTEDEIKSISDLLHNVKKSDLEAIVDIYNLAQDIYKEMDKMASDSILEESVKFGSSGSPQTSYWYDSNRNKIEVKADMEYQGSNIVSTTVRPKDTVDTNSYFNGALMKTDFGKLPYYYPMSSFQRQSSYIHPTYNSQPAPTSKPPCDAQVNYNVPPIAQPYKYLQPIPAVNYGNPPYKYGEFLKTPFTAETQKQVMQPNLLPYPFSHIQHYNMSAYPFNMYYDPNPWARYDFSKNNNQKTYYKPEEPNNEIVASNEDKKESKKTEKEQTKEKVNILDTILAKSLIINSNRPEWQTDPLPALVLDEVKAHFEEKAKLLKPFSLRKKVKLERVGKVKKLDELHREKRNIDEGERVDDTELEGDMETYIEKTTCLADVDPGYFRMGNLSQPYPACCPQRIDTR